MLRKIWQELVTLFVAAVLASLLWLYAEAEKVKFEEVEFRVEFVAPPPPAGALVITQPGTDFQPLPPQRVKIRFRGATRQIQDMQKLTETPFRLEVRDDPGRPEQSLDLRKLLEDRLRRDNLNVQITEVRPESLAVRVEPEATRLLDVRIVAPGLPLAEDASVKPRQVEVRMPASLAAALPSTIAVEAPLDLAAARNAQPGTTHVQNVALRLPPGLASPAVKLGETRAQISFTVATSKFELDAPVRLLLPSEVAAQQFVVTVPPGSYSVGPIQIEGPTRTIELIRNGSERVFALLALNTDEMARAVNETDGVLSKQVELQVPRGVEVTSARPMVTVKIEKRPAPPPVAPPPG